MTDIIKGVFDMAELALSTEPYHVTINSMKVEELGALMSDNGPISFYKEETENKRNETRVIFDIIKELVACSINYCYWYGSYDIRPNSVSSTSMYRDVERCFDIDNQALLFEKRIDNLIQTLSIHRYSLLEHRKRHLLDLCNGRKAEEFASMVNSKKWTGERLLHELVEMFPGFASDIFLKRASLFFIQLYRKHGRFENLIQKIFVPSDYQVPKVLRYFGCIEYSNKLTHMINNSILINKHSLEEIQIRAANISVCKDLQNITGWNY